MCSVFCCHIQAQFSCNFDREASTDGHRKRAILDIHFTPPKRCPPIVGVHGLRGVIMTQERPSFWGRAANAGMQQRTAASRFCRLTWTHHQNCSHRGGDLDGGAAGEPIPFLVISGQCGRPFRRWRVCDNASRPLHIFVFAPACPGWLWWQGGRNVRNFWWASRCVGLPFCYTIWPSACTGFS